LKAYGYNGHGGREAEALAEVTRPLEAHPLDNPVRSALLGGHARFAERHGRALRYPAGVVPFAALSDQPGPGDWADLAALAGPGTTVALAGVREPAPDGWDSALIGEGVQMVYDGAGDAAGDEVIRLGAADVPEMLDLTARTKPGPFLPRTHELGLYLGIRRNGVLVAMAGERLKPPGWTEISAVCTDEAWRGHGFAARLIQVLAASIQARGDTPFLHAVATNTNAIRLYEALGFRLRRDTVFRRVRVPADQASEQRAAPLAD
jgi:ribosomal protein S18 acetylase RimI-like enzyme